MNRSRMGKPYLGGFFKTKLLADLSHMTDLKLNGFSMFNIGAPIWYTVWTQGFDVYDVSQIVENDQIDGRCYAIEGISHQVNDVG